MKYIFLNVIKGMSISSNAMPFARKATTSAATLCNNYYIYYNILKYYKLILIVL